MGFINVANRKRARSSSRGLFHRHRTPKAPKLDLVLLDGAAACHIVDAESGPDQPSGYLRTRLKRTSSHIKTLLGLGNRSSDETPCPSDAGWTAPYQGSRRSDHSLHPSTCTMIVRPSGGSLARIALPPQARLAPQDSPVSGMDCNDDWKRRCSRPPSARDIGCRSSSLRRTSSTQSLRRRLSCKFHDAFAQPTVKRRSSLRNRQSVDSIVQNVVDATLSPKSAASTATSGSYVILNGGLSTPPTSDSVPVSPTSLIHSLASEPFDINRAAAIFNAEIERRRLSPISEAVAQPTFSIASVEAAASAKIFLETCFNQILSGISPLLRRRTIFEGKLNSLNLSVEMQEKA